jgi:putative endonuclease
MWYVYAIKSDLNGIIYVGMCKNLGRRLNEHNAGKSKFTKAYIPWKFIYTEFIGDISTARAKEKYLKSGIGKEFLKNLVS